MKGNQERPMLVDGHVDLTHFLMKRARGVPWPDLQHGPFTQKKAREAGVRLFCNAIYCEDRFNGGQAVDHLRQRLDFTLRHLDQGAIIRGREGLEALRREEERIWILLLLENADALARDVALVERLRQNGVRIVGLTHRGRNGIGDGDGVPLPQGFTPAGKEVIRTLGNQGFLIDVAHLHHRCFWDLTDIYQGTMVTSHTGIKEVCPMERNIDLQQAGEIIARGGIVGISLNPEMLTPKGKANMEEVFVHMDVLVQRFGPDAVGLGSDFCGFERPVAGLEDIAKVPRLAAVMRGHGYEEEAIRKIMGLNWLRVYERLFHSP